MITITPDSGKMPHEAQAETVSPEGGAFALHGLIGAAYFLAAALAIHVNSEAGNIACFWAASGILLTALIRLPKRFWPSLLVVAGTADFSASLYMGTSPIHAVGNLVVGILEPLLVAVALRRYAAFTSALHSMRWTIVFGVSSIAAALIAASIGSFWLDFLGVAPFPMLWLPWVIADVLGFFIVTPFLLSWTEPSIRQRLSRGTTIETVALGVLIAAVSIIVFAGLLPFLFLPFPFLVLLGLRGGLLGATTGILLLASLGTWSMMGELGPIAALSQRPSDQVLILQLYLFAAAVTTLSVALIMALRRRLADGLRQQTVISQVALDNMAEGLSMFDRERRLVTCNRRYVELYQLPSNLCVPGTKLSDLAAYHAAVGAFAGSSEEYVERLEIEARDKTTTELTLANGQIIQINRCQLSDGGWVSTHEDITAQRLANERIFHLARYDSLTELPNRSHFGDRLSEAFDARKFGRDFALHSIDLDRFKEVNDTLGHHAGDMILKQAAARLQGVVGPRNIVARIGGDEFSILQFDVGDDRDATALAERVLEALHRPFDSRGHPVMVGATIGIVMSTQRCPEADDLMKKCDQALYRAKEEGRGGYCLFEDGMDVMLQAQRQLERELGRALSRQELELVYQPILDLRTNAIVGFEALARWNHPSRGVVAPLEFISVAEEKGLIIPIGEWALREACTTAAGWPDHIRVAVNLSPVQFKTENLVDAVASALAASGLRPDRLELEITESVLLLDNDSVVRTLNRLHALGVRLAMDDFGTGYSSLAYLRSFPFDKIKIDKTFIQGIANDDCLAIVQATVALASKLGIETTAEGIETPRQLAVVREEGCTEGQGYLIKKPLARSKVADFMEERGQSESLTPDVRRHTKRA